MHINVDSDITEQYNTNYTKFEAQKENIGSYIKEKKIIFIDYDVNYANPFMPEGAVHCIFKQRFAKI